MENRKEQIEALETLSSFNSRLIDNIPTLAEELSDQKLEDTDKFCKSTLDAINWEISVMNGTMGVLNEDKERIDKAEFNEKMVNLSDAIKSESDKNLAVALMELVPQFEKLQGAIEEVLV